MDAHPPAVLRAGPLVLRRWHRDDAAGLAAAVGESLEHLRPWMPWAQAPPTLEDERRFLAAAVASFELGRDFGYSMRLDDDPTAAIVGAAGLHDRLRAPALEIGYWVHVAHLRRGFASAAAGALTDAAFALGGVERVEIHCDAANAASASVPPRLGYRFVREYGHAREAPGETGVRWAFATTREEWCALTSRASPGRP